MVWIEIVCDSCCDNPFGEIYKSDSVSKLKQKAKEAGWKTIEGKMYCPKCQKLIDELKAEIKISVNE